MIHTLQTDENPKKKPDLVANEPQEDDQEPVKLRSEVGMEAWGVWQSEFSTAHWITTTTTGRDFAANRWQACKWCRSTVAPKRKNY